MDRAVLDAYSWPDIPKECDFLLDYEADDEDDSGRRKPWRFRWPDEVRDEVLARLLALNVERAEAERLQGTSKAERGVRRSQIPHVSGQAQLFEEA